MANGAQFNRVKVWNDEKLTDTDLNAEFDEIYDNGDADGWGSAETTAANARESSSPGDYTTPNVPVNIHDQIKYLRYVLGRVIGGTNNSYLDTIPTNLTLLASPSNRGAAFSIEFDGNKGGASNTTDILAKLINNGSIINALSWNAADISTSDFDSTNFKFGTYSYKTESGNVLCHPGHGVNPYKGTLSCWFRNFTAGGGIAYNPLLGIELLCESVSGRLQANITSRAASSESAKTTYSVTGVDSRTGDTTFRNAILQWRTNDENGAGTDLVNLFYGGTAEGTALSAQNIDINPGDGGFWFFGCKKNEPTAWDHVYAANGLPTAHSSPWTANGTIAAAVSNGSLNMTTASTNTGYYSRSSLVNLPAQTIEFKAKINSVGDYNLFASPFHFFIRDASVDRAFEISITDKSVRIVYGDEVGAGDDSEEREIFLNTKEWNVYRMTFSGNEGADEDITFNLYINGLLVFSAINTTTNTDASDIMYFGDDRTDAEFTLDADIEYFKICDSEVAPPVASNSQGNLDSIGIAKLVADSSAITSLQSSTFSDVFSISNFSGVNKPFSIRGRYQQNSNLEVTSTTWSTAGSTYDYYIMGDGVTEWKIDLAASASANASTVIVGLAIDINGDMEGETISQGANDNPAATTVILNTSHFSHLVTSRSVVLSPGLHTIKPVFGSTSDTARYVRGTIFFNITPLIKELG